MNRNQDYVAPALDRDAFHCPQPSCGTYAQQRWGGGAIQWNHVSVGTLPGWSVAECNRCGEYSTWRYEELIYPQIGKGEPSHPDMPEDVRAIYQEAQDVSAISRKSAAALLRLGLQLLVDELEPGAGDINAKIGRLVQKGLPTRVQRAMDSLRIIGNEAVHPGTIQLDGADRDKLVALFKLVNLVVEEMIARDKVIDELYASLPEGKLGGVERRDAPK